MKAGTAASFTVEYGNEAIKSAVDASTAASAKWTSRRSAGAVATNKLGSSLCMNGLKLRKVRRRAE